MNLIEQRINTLFSEFDRSDSPGCALAVLQEGEIIFSRGYGMADLERSISIQTNTVFDIASSGKQFSSMLTLLLAEEGVLNLEAPIREFIPELHPCCDPIHIRHLLHHTSGLRDYCDLMALSDSPAQNYHPEPKLLGLISMQKELNFPPGDEYQYSNSGYFLLGPIIQRITNRPFLELIQDRILNPLQMKHTYFNDDFSRIVPHRALAYIPDAEAGYRTEISMCGGFGDGPLLTSVEDLSLWDQNFIENRLPGGEKLIQAMETPGRLNNGTVTHYGCGLKISNYQGLRTISHTGSWAGYRSQLIRFPGQRFSVIVLANVTSLDPSLMAQKVADLFLKSSIQSRETPIPDLEAKHFKFDLEKRVGFYKSARTGEILELISRDNSFSVNILEELVQLRWKNADLLSSIEDGDWLKIGFQEIKPEEPCKIEVHIENQQSEIYFRLQNAPILSINEMMEFCGTYHSSEIPADYHIFLDGANLQLQIGYAKPIPLRLISTALFIGDKVDLQFERGDFQAIQIFWLGSGRIRPIRFKRII